MSWKEGRMLTEIISGGPSNRIGNFIEINSLLDLDYYNKPVASDVYSSLYLHTEEIRASYKKWGSLKHYQGPVRASGLNFDFDDEFTEAAMSDAKRLIESVCRNESLGVSVSDIHVWFSGNKGIHVLIAAKEITDLPASRDVPTKIKQICASLAHGLKTWDSSPYDCKRIWRVPNTINSKSGLYKIPLIGSELWYMPAFRVRQLAKSKRTLRGITATAVQAERIKCNEFNRFD